MEASYADILRDLFGGAKNIYEASDLAVGEVGYSTAPTNSNIKIY
jgi:hypothetical protein